MTYLVAITRTSLVGVTRGLIFGAGFGYIMQNKYYTHIPVLCVVPNIYIGYQLYKHRDSIINLFNL
jgi:hypothetical protein